MWVFINCIRNPILAMPAALQKRAAMREAKMFVVPKALRSGIFVDSEVSDKLVSDEMGERFLEITPPVFRLIPDFDLVINEIEQSYVIGNDFSALSASCVVIEGLLNKARIDLHKHHKPIKRLWKKGPINDWLPNIDALKVWGYLDDAFASELSDVYRNIRCTYLHCGPLQCLRQHARRVIAAAYKLMTIFIGFPEDLFSWQNGGPVCKNEAEPRFLEFYKPYWQDTQ